MVSKLKLKCGNQFTAKLEGMMTDLTLGKDHQAAFQDYLKGKVALKNLNLLIELCLLANRGQSQGG